MSTTYKGIDVSKYQGEINWESVKNDGITFAFIRVGWAGYEGGIDEGFDPYFDKNMENAIKAGINVGVYVYSYCKSTTAAKRAAKEAINLFKKYEITMPIAFDMEDSNTYKSFSKDANNSIAKSFLDEILNNGYYPILYTYTNFANTYLNLNSLREYDLWLADYRGYMGIDGASIWQYSSSGTVKGISGRVDMNNSYKDYPSIIKGGDNMLDFYEVFGSKNCECFTTTDVNKVDKSYNNGKLKSGCLYPVLADCGVGSDGFHWYRLYVDGTTKYGVLLDDRSKITALSAGDAISNIAKQVPCQDTAEKDNEIAELKKSLEQEKKNVATANKLASSYLSKINNAKKALE